MVIPVFIFLQKSRNRRRHLLIPVDRLRIVEDHDNFIWNNFLFKAGNVSDLFLHRVSHVLLIGKFH